MLLQLQPILEGTDWAIGWILAHLITLAFLQNKRSKQETSRANNLVLFLFGWNSVRKSAKSQQN